MSCLLRALLAGVFLLLLHAGALAEEMPALRVGYIESPGYFRQNSHGNYRGMLYENIEVVASYAGFKPVYQRLTPEEAQTALERGEVDAVAGIISPDDYDAARFSLVDQYIGNTPIYLARPYEEVTEPRRSRIGYFAPLYSTLLEFWPPGTVTPLDGLELIPYDDWEQFYLDYYRGKVDGYITSDYCSDNTISMERILMSANIYLAVRKGNAALEERLEKAIREALRIQPNFRAEVAKETLARVYPLVLDRAEREYLYRRPVVRLASSGQQVPFVYFEDGEARGILREIISLIEADLGLRFEIVETANNTELLALLQSGRIDAHPTFPLDHNWAREMNARLTPSYCTFDHVPVMRRYEDLPAEPRVACPRQYLFVKDYVEERFPPDQIVWRDSFPECFEAVSKGEADILFAKSLTVQQELQSGKHANLFTNGQTVASQPMCIAVSQSADPRLLTILTKEVEHLNKARVNEIFGRYMSEISAHRSWQAFLNENPLRAVGIVLGLSALIIGGLITIMGIRHKAERQLFDAAYVNPLTGIHTISWFEKFVPGLIEKRHARARRAGELFLMSFASYRFDLLKAVYDQNTLYAGIARLIAEVRAKNAWLLHGSISSELSHMYILCRQEAGMTMLDAAERIMQDAAEIRGDSASIRMSYRVGLCQVPPEGNLNLLQLMANASIAQNEAVLHGEVVGIYDESLQNRRVLEKKIEDLMYKALEQEEFQVWLQPKYDLTTRRVIGAESLVRWQSPEMGFLMPYQFISLFEQNGFIIPFDYYMLEHVCRLQKRFLREGKKVVPVAVNQSGIHIREAGYVEHMRELTRLYDLPPGTVELELTETAFIDYDTKEESDNAAAIVAALREMGYAVAMDDFCTGYSSIAMLHRLPMDVMKIDRAMLLASEDSPRGQKILKNVVNFGESLDMLVLCEGIETQAQEAMLLANGCRYGQGFLFARPMPEEQYATFLETHEVEDAHAVKERGTLA